MGVRGCAPRKLKKESTLKSRIFGIFFKLKWSLLQWHQSRIRIKIFFNFFIYFILFYFLFYFYFFIYFILFFIFIYFFICLVISCLCL